jgi:drug/metabolite transporter (DMT)-like permease
MASFLYFVPVFATLIAWVWLGEVPRFVSLTGGAIAIAGVIVVNLWGRRPLGFSRDVSS